MTRLKWLILIMLVVVAFMSYIHFNGNPYKHYQLKHAVTEHFNNDGASRMLNIQMKSKYNRYAENQPYFLEVYFDLNGIKGDYHYYIFEDEQVKATKSFSDSLETVEDVEFFSD